MAVTGGASGIGFEVARQWLNGGGKVLLLDMNVEALAGAVQVLGKDARGIQLDVTNRESVEEAFADISQTEGKLNGLVNCAGFARHARVDGLDDADFAKVLDVHLGGAMRVCQAAYPLLKLGSQQNETAAVVNVSSVAGINGTPGRGSYGTAKAGILGLTRTLAVEWGPDSVRVNAVGPGPTRTALVDELIGDQQIRVDPLTKRTPLGRMPVVEEVASPIVFLCSDKSSFVNGACLPIDGGLTIDGSWYD
ncbi:SDR family oxidoreductase [Yaniella flava]|uniref:SDR family NAD(P)-dependent oxidoreductase n=1 Tax=Yaniella flava TaxID=287930 RepID=UPI0031DBCE04